MGKILDKAASLVILGFLVFFAIGAIRHIVSSWEVPETVLTAFAIVIILALSPLALLAVSPFILGPLRIHRTHWYSLDPVQIPFDPDGPESPPVLRSHFAGIAEELSRLGFSPRRYYRTKYSSNNAEGSVLLFCNEASCETARVLTAVSMSGPRIASTMVVFRSEFSDGTQVITANATTPTIFPPPKAPIHSRSFPQVRDLGLLLVLHRARVENFAAGQTAVDMVRDDPDGYLRRVDFEEPSAYHVACGYKYNDELARVQRMTWKGAILVSWKLLSPVKQIRQAWKRLMAARQIANLKAGRPVS